MIFDMMEFGKAKEFFGRKVTEIYCGCSFCRGGLQREDVKHYKLFSISNSGEYYLHIDETNRKVEILEKY